MRWRSQKKPRVKPTHVEITPEDREALEGKIVAIVKRLYEEGTVAAWNGKRALANGQVTFDWYSEEAAVHPQAVTRALFGLNRTSDPAKEAGRRYLVRATLMCLARRGLLETYRALADLDLNPLGRSYVTSHGQRRQVTCYRPVSLLMALAVASKEPSARKRRAHH